MTRVTRRVVGIAMMLVGLALIGFAAAATPAQAYPSTDPFIVPGQCIAVPAAHSTTFADQLVSDNGLFRLRVLDSSRFRISRVSDGSQVWISPNYGSGTADSGVTLNLQTDGNLVLRSGTGLALWNAGTIPPGSYPGTRSNLENGGTLTVSADFEDGTSRVLWRNTRGLNTT